MPVNSPNPALVTQRAAQRLPRVVLWLFCAAYVLPGVLYRDAWKNADITAFGFIRSLVRGDSSWWHPAIAGFDSEGSALPYWLGAWSVNLLGSWIDPALAARLPFTAMLAAALFFTWYAAFHLALTDEAQPLPFAFGGEAPRVDYARTMADAAVLALIAPLGLLQLGHETTPELVQLAGVSAWLYGVASSRHRRWQSALSVTLALPVLAASGAATTALLLGLASVVLVLRSTHLSTRSLVIWIAVGLFLAVDLAFGVGAWRSRLGEPTAALGIFKLALWFMWPVWPLAAWTLWRWRRQITQHHLLIPLVTLAITVGASAAMGASDRALMLSLPALAVLAAFSLPTLKRSVSAPIDWFSVFFFSIAALTLWVIYASVQTGWPAQPAINIERLAPGFVHRFHPIEFAIAACGSLAWLWLVRWRTSQHRPALWKSLVLPAGGVSLMWLLLMTLWLPLLDYARSYNPLMRQLERVIPSEACLAVPQAERPQVAALEALGRWKLTREAEPRCDWMLLTRSERINRPVPDQHLQVPDGWTLVAKKRRPTDRSEVFYVYRRTP